MYFCVMKSRLNLTIDEELLAQVKQYAESHEMSVSEMVETYFKTITKVTTGKNIIELVEGLRKSAIPDDIDLKEEYFKMQSKKYGF